MRAPIVSNHRLIAGVDPGLSGAVVVYDATSNTVVDARIIPTIVLTRNRKSKRVLDKPALVGLFREIGATYPTSHVVMELVGAHRMNGRVQGVTSMFTFGDMAGSIETAIIAAGLPFQKVAPALWKTALGCPKEKDLALARATDLIPESALFWTPARGRITKESCKGVAEAAMIAYWGGQQPETQEFLMVA